jgi:copper homeostasis protein
MHKLEVIVMSATEAVIAKGGGADRLELVRDLDTGGLTPDWATVRAVCDAVSIPIRVMLRENPSMAVASAGELQSLQTTAAKFQQLPIDGLVMGWVTTAGAIDVVSLETVLAAAPRTNVTFHRAFEHLTDPFAGIQLLRRYRQIDKILTGGGAGSWPERKQRLCAWSIAASPEITILVGGGLTDAEVAELMADPQFPEVHVGRAARTPQQNDGALNAAKIALLKRTQ